jgi:pimeloyl-ACP methyl ester carboxylesterase
MFYHTKEELIEVQGGKMLCISFGDGKKPLVAIPGLRLTEMAGTGKFAALYYKVFAREYRVYLFDRKDNLPPDCTVHDLAEDIAAAMAKLSIENTDVLGVSQGGMIAQELAITHPALVRKLVLGVTLSRPNPTIQEAVGGWIGMAERGDMDAVVYDYAERASSEKMLKRNRKFLPIAMKMQKMIAPERFAILAKACLTCNTYDRLQAIHCPVLVLGGAQDKVVSGEASAEIAEKLGCECYIYPDQSHEAYNEAKDFNQRIYDFFMR